VSEDQVREAVDDGSEEPDVEGHMLDDGAAERSALDDGASERGALDDGASAADDGSV
jgi:hypothetical protein